MAHPAGVLVAHREHGPQPIWSLSHDGMPGLRERARVSRSRWEEHQVIVVGFIATAEGRSALEAAVAEAQRRGEPLQVLAHGARGSDQSDIDSTVTEARERLAGTDVGFEVRQVQRGDDVAEALMNAAAEGDASLIVIGLRRRSPLGKLILGSNAQRILLDAPCHVLAVKPDPA